LTGIDGVERMSQPWLTYLDHLQISGDTEYAPGDELALQVTAVYSNGCSRDVTARCNYTGFDFGKSGHQTVTVRYTEGLAESTAAFDVYVLPSDTPSLPTEEPTAPPPTEAPVQEPAQEAPALPTPALIFAAICLVLLALLLLIKARQRSRRRSGKKPTRPHR